MYHYELHCLSMRLATILPVLLINSPHWSEGGARLTVVGFKLLFTCNYLKLNEQHYGCLLNFVVSLLKERERNEKWHEDPVVINLSVTQQARLKNFTFRKHFVEREKQKIGEWEQINVSWLAGWLALPLKLPSSRLKL